MVKPTLGLFVEPFIRNVLLLKKYFVHLSVMLTALSRFCERAGAHRLALWLEYKAELCNCRLAADNFSKRF